jgi:PAS domain S-box-containing protein
MEFRIRRADGEIRWMEHICQPVYARDGSFAGRRASTRDVTDSKRAAAALASREQELATLTAHVPDVIARFDRALRYQYVNAAIETATGFKPEQLIGRTCGEAGIADPFCTACTQAVDRVFAGAEPVQFEVASRNEDGEERFYRGQAVPEGAPDGSVASVVCTIRDDSALREAESMAARLATIVETSTDFIGLARLDGCALYLNRAGQRLVGLADAEAVGATAVADYLFPEDLPRLHEALLPAVLRDGSWTGDFRFRHVVTGEAIAVHWTIVRIDDKGSGKAIQLATVARDIREQKAAETALREADRRKDEFLAVLGHELRNPMAPIRNAIEVLRLLTDTDADSRIGWAIDVLGRQSSNLTRLLDDLLDVSRIVRGNLKLQRRAVTLRELVEQAAEAVRPLMDERGHRFEIALPDPDVSVDGDPVRLVQILVNLLLNAATYTAPEGQITIDWHASDVSVDVCVMDNGPGIPQDRLEELFAPFARGHGAGDKGAAGPGGLGLGLTISRRLAELHGGRLEAVPIDCGSQLRLVLPRDAGADAESVPPAARASASDKAGAPLRVLVVEDNADVAEAMIMLLRTLGHRAEAASSGPQALELAPRLHPHLALVDIGLPGMDGLEVARRLRKAPNAGLRLVALTGFGHQRARDRSLAAGFDEHLAKPVDRVTLEAVLARSRPPRHDV